MKSDSELKKQGLELLIAALGEVDAEKFISLIIKEQFDYSKWQKSLWSDKTIDEIHEKAANYAKKAKY
jgi:hypothetical protein